MEICLICNREFKSKLSFALHLRSHKISIIEYTKEYLKPELCEYGCGRKAVYFFEAVRKWCCESHYQKCPNTKNPMDYENSKANHKKAMSDPTYKENMRLILDKYWTDDKREEHSVKMKELAQTDEWRNAFEENYLKAINDPSHRENYLKAISNPEVLAYRNSKIKEHWDKEENRLAQKERLNKPKTKLRQKKSAP